MLEKLLILGNDAYSREEMDDILQKYLDIQLNISTIGEMMDEGREKIIKEDKKKDLKKEKLSYKKLFNFVFRSSLADKWTWLKKKFEFYEFSPYNVILAIQKNQFFTQSILRYDRGNIGPSSHYNSYFMAIEAIFNQNKEKARILTPNIIDNIVKGKKKKRYPNVKLVVFNPFGYTEDKKKALDMVESFCKHYPNKMIVVLPPEYQHLDKEFSKITINRAKLLKPKHESLIIKKEDYELNESDVELPNMYKLTKEEVLKKICEGEYKPKFSEMQSFEEIYELANSKKKRNTLIKIRSFIKKNLPDFAWELAKAMAPHIVTREYNFELDNTISSIIEQFEDANQDDLALIVKQLKMYSLRPINKVKSVNTVGVINCDSEVFDLGPLRYGKGELAVVKMLRLSERGALGAAFREGCCKINALRPFFVDNQYFFALDLGDEKRYGIMISDMVDKRTGILTKDTSCMYGAFKSILELAHSDKEKYRIIAEVKDVSVLLNNDVYRKIYFAAMSVVYNNEIAQSMREDEYLKKNKIVIPRQSWKSFKELACKRYGILKEFEKRYEDLRRESHSNHIVYVQFPDTKTDNTLEGIVVDQDCVFSAAKELQLIKNLNRLDIIPPKVWESKYLVKQFLRIFEGLINYGMIAKQGKEYSLCEMAPDERLVEIGYNSFEREYRLSNTYEIFNYSKKGEEKKLVCKLSLSLK